MPLAVTDKNPLRRQLCCILFAHPCFGTNPKAVFNICVLISSSVLHPQFKQYIEEAKSFYLETDSVENFLTRFRKRSPLNACRDVMIDMVSRAKLKRFYFLFPLPILSAFLPCLLMVSNIFSLFCFVAFHLFICVIVFSTKKFSTFRGTRKGRKRNW
jgi:hypothetical protein